LNSTYRQAACEQLAVYCCPIFPLSQADCQLVMHGVNLTHWLVRIKNQYLYMNTGRRYRPLVWL